MKGKFYEEGIQGTIQTFFSPLIHVDEEISLQTGQEIFREAKLNPGKKIFRRSKDRNSWISFKKIKILKEIILLGKTASMMTSL